MKPQSWEQRVRGVAKYVIFSPTIIVERCVVPKMNILSDKSNREVLNSSDLMKFKSSISGACFE